MLDFMYELISKVIHSPHQIRSEEKANVSINATIEEQILRIKFEEKYFHHSLLLTFSILVSAFFRSIFFH